MRYLAGLLLVLALLLGAGPAAGRTWTSRDGKHTVEAELLDFRDGKVMLRRDDGKGVIEVELETFSLGDVKYVREALEAAGRPIPPALSAPASASGPSATPAEPPKPVPVITDPGGPPLAKANVAAWQVVPDGSEDGYGLPPGVDVAIDAPSMGVTSSVVFPSAPSPFVAVGGDYGQAARQLWDLRTGQLAGRIDAEIRTSSATALSPDGKYLAVLNSAKRRQVELWSFSSGRMERAVELPSQNFSLAFLDFAGPSRLIVGPTSGTAYIIYDVATGAEIATIPVKVTFGVQSSISPGGRYLAMCQSNDGRIVFYDTRNGFHAGEVAVPGSGSFVRSRPESLTFSPDGRALAALVYREKGCALAVWSLKDGKAVCQPEFPFGAFDLVWCGSGHVMIRPSDVEENLLPLIDVGLGLVVWRYQVENGTDVWTTPDDRHWFLTAQNALASGELSAMKLPDEQTGQFLAKTEIPKPVVGRGAAVALNVVLEQAPVSIPQGWPELANLERDLKAHYRRLLEKKEVEVSPQRPNRVIVGVQPDNVECEIVLRSFLGLPSHIRSRSYSRLPPHFGPSTRILLTAPRLIAYVAVVDSEGHFVWGKKQVIENSDVRNQQEKPERMDSLTFLTLERWSEAARWLRSVDIPSPIYHSSVQRGLGESILTPSGARTIRSPSPVKPDNRTAALDPSPEAAAARITGG